MRGRDSDKKTRAVFSTRWIPNKGRGGRYYTSASFVISKNLSLGLDYRPLIGEVEFLANWRMISEASLSSWNPAVVLGTSREDYTRDNIERNSRAYYITISKSLSSSEWLSELPVNLSPYVGVAHLEAFDQTSMIGGLHLRKDDLSAMIQYSGENLHFSVSYDLNEETSASFILWGLDQGFDLPGLSVVYRF